VAYTILHIGDVHLDMTFAAQDPEFAKLRRRQQETAFERALQLARDRRVDALCIAGDLFEKEHSGPDRAAYLRRKLGELAPMRVFISPGNHDPYTADSLYRLMEPLPDNVTIFGSRRMTPVRLAERLTLWGFGHERELDGDPAIGDFMCTGDGTHLLLFHGSDQERIPPGKNPTAPFTSADIKRTGAAHAMIGHFHGMVQAPQHAYTGSLEPHNHTQDGRHTACLVTVEDGQVGLDFIDVGVTRYARIEFDVTPYGDKKGLAEALAAKLHEVAATPGEVFLRVHLVGALAPSADFDAGDLERELAAQFVGLEVNADDVGTFDLAAIEREGQTVRAAFVNELVRNSQALSDDDRALNQQALRYGLLAFAKKPLRP